MKKRIVASSILLTIVLSVFIVSADIKKIGDVIGKVLYTDIKTYIDGYEIESYNIGGRTVIPVESLKAYGYNVKWNDKERRLDVISPATSTISGKVALPEGTVAPKGGINIQIDALVNSNDPNIPPIDGMNLWGIKSTRVIIPEGKGSIEYSIPVLLEYKDAKFAENMQFTPKYVLRVHYNWLIGSYKAERGFYGDKTLDLSTGLKTNIDYTIDISTK